ncbi:MAG: hypothetical protein ACYC6Y_17425 [Thermoguttaceae bacterium]
MTACRTHLVAILALFLLEGGAMGGSVPGDPLAGPPGWKRPLWSELRAQVTSWLESTGADSEMRASVVRRWPEAEPPQVTDRLVYLVESFALVDSRVADMIRGLTAEGAPRTPPAADWLDDEKTPRFVSNNCRLYLGRWAAQQQLYDEASERLDGLDTDGVADPAALLFYQAVVRQRLLQKERALESLARLMQNPDEVPRRYVAVAELMRPDLENLEADSLDHIARRMDDIRRRLQLGRADGKVLEIEKEVIESLDKLIEEAKRRRQQQGQQAGSPKGSESAQPAPDSRILPGRGPGDVTSKNIGDGEGWGNLPPKQREAALQQIGREFPAHYRDAIEQYFRRLAGSESKKE